MKAVISDGFLSEKYSFYSVSPDQLENSKDTKECYVKLRNLTSETIKLFSKDAPVEVPVKPGQTIDDNKCKNMSVSIFHTCNKNNCSILHQDAESSSIWQQRHNLKSESCYF